MNHKSLWTILAVVAVSVLLVMGATAQGIDDPEAVTIQAQVGHAFSYQGRLENNDTTVTDSCDFQFGLFNAASSGTQIGATQTSNNVSVADGYFNATLDFGSDAFTGEARWLEIQVRCPSGGGVYTQLTPRQELTPAPYALGLVPGAQIQGNVETYSVFGVSNEGSGNGIYGETEANTDYVSAGVMGYSVYTNTFGVLGESEHGIGVEGRITNPNNTRSAVIGYNTGGGKGIAGYSDNSHGVYGETRAAGSYEHAGVRGYSTYSRTFGILGESDMGTGVQGRIINVANTNPAVTGWNEGSGEGVYGRSVSDFGVEGETLAAGYYENAGVRGYSTYSRTFGILGESLYGIGVEGRILEPTNYRAAVVGYHEGAGEGVHGYSANNYGVLGEGATYGVAAMGGMLAPKFDVGNPDLAEFVPTAGGNLEAGDVVVISQKPNGEFGVRRATQAYDTAAAGIVSTAPGITLGVRDGNIIEGSNEEEVPLALAGRVPCKVDASFGAIAIGDLLTTSPTPGHAMRCDDRINCIGAIIGKALQPLEDGTGVIQVLVTLQ